MLKMMKHLWFSLLFLWSRPVPASSGARSTPPGEGVLNKNPSLALSGKKCRGPGWPGLSIKVRGQGAGWPARHGPALTNHWPTRSIAVWHGTSLFQAFPGNAKNSVGFLVLRRTTCRQEFRNGAQKKVLESAGLVGGSGPLVGSSGQSLAQT